MRNGFSNGHRSTVALSRVSTIFRTLAHNIGRAGTESCCRRQNNPRHAKISRSGACPRRGPRPRRLPAAAAPLRPAQQAGIDAIAESSSPCSTSRGSRSGSGATGRCSSRAATVCATARGHLAADAGTAYAIGSITKQFTASAVWLLAQQHRIDVDADAVALPPGRPSQPTRHGAGTARPDLRLSRLPRGQCAAEVR